MCVPCSCEYQERQKEGAEVSDGYEPQVIGDSIQTPVLLNSMAS